MRRSPWSLALLAVCLAACSGGEQATKAEKALAHAQARTAATGAALQAIAGTWVGQWRSPGGASGALQIDWRQTGRAMRGVVQVTGACLPGGPTTGLLNDGSVDFSIASSDAQIRYIGTVAGRTMSGTFTATCGDPSGAWDAALR